MNESSFGALLGQLVYAKRKTLGLTQLQLAEDAFGTAGKTRRISELESGQVANPHAKTIDPIIVTLGISEVELEECAKAAVSEPDSKLSAAYSEASEMLDKLAEQFDNSNPDASLAELGEFLDAKAKEYFDLKEKIGAFESPDRETEALIESAKSALERGEFSSVDNLLCEAEEVQLKSKTLEQVGKQASLRKLRGDAHFLSGNLPKCFDMYKGAALYFEHFDVDVMLATFQELARIVYETGRRSLEPTYWVAEKLLEEALSRSNANQDPETVGGIHYRLSLILRNQHNQQVEGDRESSLKKATDHARNAAVIFSRSNQNFEQASAQISLGNCLSDTASLKGDAEIGSQAIVVFEEVKKTISADSALDPLMGHACGGLAAAIMRTFAANPIPSQEKETHKKAVAEYEEALAAAVRNSDHEIWGTSQINLGRLYSEIAMLDDIEHHEAQFLRTRSISSFLAAIETYPEVQFPQPFAEAHFGMAETLFDHGLHAEDSLFELYFMRAIHSFTQAAEIFTEQTDPQRWAHIQCRLGSVFGNHARRANSDVAKHDLEQAISYFEEGVRVFGLCGYTEGVKSSEKNIGLLKDEQERLNCGQ
ncbi:MAG: helix-turn-helix domain-containing protein [Roseobacter sp.]